MKIVFRVDSSNIIGSGHVMRCLNLAGYFDASNVIFICKKFQGNLINIIETKYQVITIEGSGLDTNINFNTDTWLGEEWDSDAKKTCDILKILNEPIDLFIVDHYGTNEEWDKEIYKYVKKLVVIDDLKRTHYCDVLIDYNTNDSYNTNSNCIQLLGNMYPILNKEIETIIPKKITELKRVNISLGADINDKTLKILEICNRSNLDIEYDVIIGSSHKSLNKIKEFCEKTNNFKLHVNLQNKEFLELLNQCDLCIGGAGLTNYERCILNKPLLYTQIADNQTVIVNKLKEHNIGIFLGDELECISNMLNSYYLDSSELLSLSANCHEFSNINYLYNVYNFLINDQQ